MGSRGEEMRSVTDFVEQSPYIEKDGLKYYNENVFRSAIMEYHNERLPNTAPAVKEMMSSLKTKADVIRFYAVESVCNVYGVTESELLGKSKKGVLPDARFTLISIMSMHIKNDSEIARQTGYRDNTSILHARRRHNEILEVYPHGEYARNFKSVYDLFHKILEIKK